MNKTFWIAFVVIYVVMQCIGFLVHGLWLEETYQPLWGAVLRPEAEFNSRMWLMFVTSAVYLYLFCYIFTKGYEGKGIGEGARYGLLIGLLLAAALADNYVLFPLDPNLAATWFVVSVVSFVIAGILLAAIYKPTSAARTPAAAPA